MLNPTDPRVLAISFITAGISKVAGTIAEALNASPTDSYLTQFGSAGVVIAIAYWFLRREVRLRDQVREDLVTQAALERVRADAERAARVKAEQQLMRYIEKHPSLENVDHED